MRDTEGDVVGADWRRGRGDGRLEGVGRGGDHLGKAQRSGRGTSWVGEVWNVENMQEVPGEAPRGARAAAAWHRVAEGVAGNGWERGRWRLFAQCPPSLLCQ